MHPIHDSDPGFPNACGPARAPTGALSLEKAWSALHAPTLIVLFIAAPLPREVIALVAAGLLMMSRRLHSHKMLGLVDWQLLVLFIGLFVVYYEPACR